MRGGASGEDESMFSVKPMHFVMLTIGAVTLLSSLPAAAQESKGWFVVREETTSNCHVQQLVAIDGNYVSGTGLRAGGPYDTRDEALKRLDQLRQQGVCTKD